MDMNIIYDKKKADRLLRERSIDLEDIAVLLTEHRFLTMLDHDTRPNQKIYVVEYKGYVHAVPCIVEGQTVIIKTAYPTRKLNKKFGGKNEDKT
jgi:uncharacterized DUF497 family protein